jgi:hypothetical protein
MPLANLRPVRVSAENKQAIDRRRLHTMLRGLHDGLEGREGRAYAETQDDMLPHPKGCHHLPGIMVSRGQVCNDL